MVVLVVAAVLSFVCWLDESRIRGVDNLSDFVLSRRHWSPPTKIRRLATTTVVHSHTLVL